MNKKNRQKHAVNASDFQRATGILTIEQRGGSNCLLIDQIAVNNKSPQRVAYSIYTETLKTFNLSTNIHIFTSCGVENCISKDHIKAIYKPTKPNIKYIQDHSHEYRNDLPELARLMQVPTILFLEYLDTIK